MTNASNIILNMAREALNFAKTHGGTGSESRNGGFFNCHGDPTRPREKTVTPNVSQRVPNHSNPPLATFQDLCTGPFISYDHVGNDRYETTDDFEKQRDKMLYQYCTSRVLRDDLFHSVQREYPGFSDIRFVNVSPQGEGGELVARLSKDMSFKAKLSEHVNETIDLPEGSLVKLDQEGMLIEATVFERMDIPLSAGSIFLNANSLIHFENGGFATSILASDQLYRDNPLKGGRLVRWHLDALVAGGLKDSIPGDLKDAILRRDILRNEKTCRHDARITIGWETNRMFKRGSLLTCHKTKTRTVHHGLPLENAKNNGTMTEGFIVGTVWHDNINLHDMDFVKIEHTRGTIISLTPVDETTLQDKLCMAGHEVAFHENGKIKRFTPAENVEIGRILWWKGRPVELDEDGKVVSGTPFNDQVIGGVKCPHGSEILLHGNGRVKRAFIAEGQTIDGVEVNGAQTIELDAEGHILKINDVLR